MNLHLLHTGPLSVNTYLIPIYENKVIIVDPADCGYSRDEGSVLSYLNSNKLLPLAIVLTHGHFDHVSGLPLLKKTYTDIPIAIHKEDASLIGKNSFINQKKALTQMGFDEFLPYVSELPEADCFLEDGKTLDEIFSGSNFSEEIKTGLSQWEVIHTPGHTEGSCCLYNEEKHLLVSGDTIFYHSWGRTDLIGGDERKIHQSLLKVADYCDGESLVYPGHEYTGFTLEENF